jgi:hypothetical protein
LVQIDLPVAITLVVGVVTALATSVGILFRALSTSYEARISELKMLADQRIKDKDDRIADLLDVLNRQTGTAERQVAAQVRLTEVVERHPLPRGGRT